MRLSRLIPLFTLITVLAPGVLRALASTFQHAEARHVHPLEMTPDGARLLAVDSVNARLSVFDITGPAPVLVAEIPTGLEPVSVRARTLDEVWVVNELSDSVSVISLASESVIATLHAPDEPADVAFAQGKAFVTCARSNTLRVFDAATRAQLAVVPLEGLYPRALAVSADGQRVYAAFLDSGNRTTILKKESAPPPPAPTNNALPAPPQVALIVPADDPRVAHTTLDHDVVEIETASHSITGYASGVGTNLFDLAERPGTGDLWVANTEALNLVRFEPNLRGHFADSRLTRISAGTGAVTPFDLNPGIDYGLLPNPAARATALAQPMSLIFEQDGAALWTAAFASDRVAKINPADGSVLARVDLRTGADTSAAKMRGPRGLALDAAGQRLFVLNKLSHTLSVVDTAGLAVTHEVKLARYDPTPRAIKAGRGFLFDARLSGNGTNSCGICHIDADRDGLAWDLGDPGGAMMTVLGANLSIHDTTPRPRVMHPMKGPMTTQTLRGMQDGAPFHWRGDRATLADFNPTFDLLMGGSQIDPADMADLTAYLLSIVHHPNPNRNQDRTLPTSFAGGNPVAGRTLFNDHIKSHCITCHLLPKGTDNNIDLPQEAGLNQPVKNPPLRTVYQRLFFDPRPGRENLSGFGMLHDGTGGAAFLPTVHDYVLDLLETPQEFADVTAFMLCFDTGIAPAVGICRTVTQANQAQADIVNTLNLLQARAIAGDCDLIARGRLGGQSAAFRFNASSVPANQTYQPDSAAAAAVNRAGLLAQLGAGDTLTFLGVLPGAGVRMSIDEDEDGILNRDDPFPGTPDGPPAIVREPDDRAAPPGGSATFSVLAEGEGLEYQWWRGSQKLDGKTSAELVLPGVTTADEGLYHVIVSNTEGEKTSRAARLEVYPIPVITRQPAPQKANEGKRATFTVSATGRNLSYRWRHGGADIGGADKNTLVMNGVGAGQMGEYTVVVSNGAGSVTSAPAALDVLLKPVLAPLDLPRMVVGQEIAHPLNVTPAPAKFRFTGLPAGLKLDTKNTPARIIGRPQKPGSPTVRATPSNAAGAGAEVTQQVIVDDYPADALGTYAAVIPGHDTLNENLGGLLTLTSTRLGAFSGTVTLGAARFPVKGQLIMAVDTDPEVPALTLKKRDGTQITLTATLRRATRDMEAVFTEGGAELARCAGWLPIPPAWAGDSGWTLSLRLPGGAAGDDDIPQGHGFGAFSISAKALLKGALRLADGATVTLAGSVRESGRLPFHAPLYKNSGSAQGVLRLRENGPANRLEGSALRWLKKTQTRPGSLYPGGFPALDLTVAGNPYIIPAAGQCALLLPPGDDNARLLFTHGKAPDPAARVNLSPFTLQPGSPSKWSAPAGNPGLVKMTLTGGKGAVFRPGAMGVFKGGFTLTDTDNSGAKPRQHTRRPAFHGMIVDEGAGQKGLGFFLLEEMPAAGVKPAPLRSGAVLLEGATP